jgi:hypothetical protein
VAEGPLHSGLQNRSPLCLAQVYYLTSGGWDLGALKGEPLTRETTSKTDENDSLSPHNASSADERLWTPLDEPYLI